MKTNKFHITLFLLSMIWNLSFSQNYINYTEKDGLASNFVYRMTQDNEGFIWFLTDKGISKFDGKTFKNFTTKEGLPTNDNWHIRITPDNRVWYFSRSDALGYIKNDSIFKFKASDGKMMNPNGRIFQSGNDMSFVSLSNVYKFSDSIWQSSRILNRKNKLLNRDVFIVSDTTYRNEYLEDKQGQHLLSLKSNQAYRNYYQFNDSLLVKSHDNYFEIINLNTFKPIYGDISHLEKSKSALYVLWFTLANNKLQLSGYNWLMTFDEKLNIEQVYNIPSQLNATDIFQDKDGFIWAATSEKGVFKLPIGYNDIISLFEGKLIHKIVLKNDDVLVSVEGEGIYKLEHNKPKLALKERLRLHDLLQYENSTYYNFRFHLVVEKEGRYTRIKNSNFYLGRRLLQYNGSFFAEGFSGIGRLSKNFESEKGYFEHPYYQGLFKQNDSLFSFSFKQMLFYNTEKDIFQAYKGEQIQQKFLANSLYSAQNYIGTEGDGLYRFSEGKLHKLIQDDTAVINQISVENSKSIWAVSEGVLLHYKGNNAGVFSKERYNQINGLPTNNLTEVLFYKNKLYLGSTTGLNIIDKAAIKRTSNFTPYVKSVYLNETKMGRDSVAYLYGKNLNLKVNFGSINFFDPNNTTFEYRLSPIQDNWITTASGEVNLYTLQPEDYTLQLKVNHNGIEKIKIIPLAVIPKWWQTELIWLVYWAVGVIVLMLFIFFVFRYYRNKLFREKKLSELELSALRSQMNPHFVHNSLNAIQYYIQRHEVELSEDYLAKFATLIRLFFEYSRRSTISIKEEVLLLKNYMDVEKLRFEEKLEYKIIVDEKIDSDEQLLPSMILQPIVENAVNHGLFHKETNGNIEIHFAYMNVSTFIVTIKDDGIGILKSKKIYKESSKNYQSRSSNVLQERLKLLKQSKEWNVSCNTEDRSQIEDSSGTLVTLTFKQHHTL